MVRRNSNRETGSCKMSKVEYSMLCFSKIAIAFCVVPAGQVTGKSVPSTGKTVSKHNPRVCQACEPNWAPAFRFA